MNLFVQTVAACPSGQLVFRDIWPCRLVIAGKERYLYVAAAFEASTPVGHSVKRCLAMMTHLASASNVSSQRLENTFKLIDIEL